ncbi:MAG: citrate lyase subunit beta / citryl-CoA lyase [Solirubrobacterales bacterium]|jgi:citrate lyase subunit beta/citryl-CoA lyase|nr:citrate lyase subunit beta / citryl-CoA lyase [Solirubrobacterales bacterium]
MLARAREIEVDEVVIDLEDSVVPEAKVSARSAAVAALASGPWKAPVLSVRVNAPRSPWCAADLLALAALPEAPFSVVLPKVESGGDLGFADRLLDGAEAAAPRRARLRLQALIETPAGVADAVAIAASSERLEALILGYADLGAALGRSPRGTKSLELWLSAQDAVLVAARTAGLQAVDGPYLGTVADAGFEAAAERARDLGFDGKWAIHPSQLEPLASLFTPTKAELERAEAVVDALRRAERDGLAGAVALDGEMLDEAIAAAAWGILARAGRSGR